MTEQQRFDVVRSFDDFEVRRYPDYVLVQAAVEGDFDRAGNRAFRPLFSYITGANVESKRFEMTAPVIQEQEGDDRFLVSFVLPDGADPASVPPPKNSAVTVRAVAAHEAAAARFRGAWSENSFRRHGDELRTAVVSAGLSPVGDVYFARFDPPWMPAFLKHNEVLIALAG
jgi:hypothetical protein